MQQPYAELHKAHDGDRELRTLNAWKCLKLVKAQIGFASVVDFGCGIGAWLAAAKRLGATQVLGIEGEWIRERATLLEPRELLVADLAKTAFDFSRSYDLALSIEVAEHLPAAAADYFCASLVNAANVVVFSAATPGQGGVNHINEQPPQYWVDRFWGRGYVPLEIIRPAILNEPKMYSWLQQNLIVFINYDVLHAQPQLARYALPRRHFYAKYAMS